MNELIYNKIIVRDLVLLYQPNPLFEYVLMHEHNIIVRFLKTVDRKFFEAPQNVVVFA